MIGLAANSAENAEFQGLFGEWAMPNSQGRADSY